MSDIWKHSRLYDFARHYVDFCIRTSYNRLEVHGRDHVPADSPVLFIPNHSNTLMDALVVLQSDRSECAFGARADIFRNPKTARILRWLRILPFARERDGRDAVRGNLSIFEEVIECIGHGVPFTIFAEGTHRTKRSLLPLKNGAFRIAIDAAGKLGRTVYIVPVGIDHSDYFYYRSSCKLTFGTPIEVTPETNMQELKARTADDLSKLFTFFPDDENYDTAVAEWESRQRRKRLPRGIAARIFVPIVIAIAAISSAPCLLSSLLIGRKMKDKAWLNTVRFAVKLVLLPVWALVVFITTLLLCGPAAAIIAAIAAWGGYDTFYDFTNLSRQ